MKLVIQTPGLDEAGTLPLTLAGFSAVAWLVVDDGSRDVARAHGGDHANRAIPQILGWPVA